MIIEIVREGRPYYEIRQHKIRGNWVIKSSYGQNYAANSFRQAIELVDIDARAFTRRMETG